MKIKEVTLEEYLIIWENAKKSMRFSSSGVDPIMKSVTVQGKSGVGHTFSNEYDRLVHEHYNPSMPNSIKLITLDGEELIVPKKKGKRK